MTKHGSFKGAVRQHARRSGQRYTEARVDLGIAEKQAFIHDPSKTVAQAVKEAEKVAGSAIKVTGFLRYALGEGIVKKEEDFAAEVAKTAAAAAR